MDAATFIGSSIFFYIIAFVIVMMISGYLVYRTRPKKPNKRE